MGSSAVPLSKFDNRSQSLSITGNIEISQRHRPRNIKLTYKINKSINSSQDVCLLCILPITRDAEIYQTYTIFFISNALFQLSTTHA